MTDLALDFFAPPALVLEFFGPPRQPQSAIAAAVGPRSPAPDLAAYATKAGEETLSHKTLTGPVVAGYTEANASPAAATSFAPDLSAATMFNYTTDGDAELQMPPALAGKSFSARVTYGGVDGLAFTPDGADTIEWAGGTPPDPSSTAGAVDVFAWTCYADGVWTGFTGGLGFA